MAGNEQHLNPMFGSGVISCTMTDFGHFIPMVVTFIPIVPITFRTKIVGEMIRSGG
jgi:hypothetical protein